MRKDSQKNRARMDDDKDELSFEFEWTKHQNVLIYENRLLSFKVKKELLVSPKGEQSAGFEVYISDNPRQKDYRPLRFFQSQDLNKVIKWVEFVAERIWANRF